MIPLIVTAEYNHSDKCFEGILIINYYDQSEICNLKRQISVFKTLSAVSQSIMDVEDLLQFFNLVLEKTLEFIFKANIGAVLLKDDHDIVHMVARNGYSQEEADAFSFKLHESFFWIETGGNFDKPLIVNDLSKFEYIKMLDSENEKKVYSTISTPIFVDEELYGFINIDSTEKNAYTDQDAEIMVFMKSQIEIAIRNQMLLNQIRVLSRCDNLTGLSNRHFINQQVDDLIEKIDGSQLFALVIFDIDGLKTVNDNYGHLTGDKIIASMANQLKKNSTDCDILGRLGGDEFIWIHPYVHEDEPQNKIDQMKIDFSNGCIFEKEEVICVQFSYGIAYYPKEGTKVSELMKIADKRMYVNKNTTK